jgi:hypothetical protein
VGCDVLHVEALIYEIDIGDNPQVVAPTSKTHHLFLYLKLSRLGIRVSISAGEESPSRALSGTTPEWLTNRWDIALPLPQKALLKLRASCGRSIRLHYVNIIASLFAVYNM